MVNKLEEILNERGNSYGEFSEIAQLSQDIEVMLLGAGNLSTAPAFAREAMKMMVHKICRIAVGDPLHSDSWRDVAGYSTLSADRIDELSARPEQISIDPDQGFHNLK